MAEMGFTLVSDAFRTDAPIPQRHTCDGENLSPHLHWLHPPEGARSFALIVDDPDAPDGTFTHWLLFDIPAATQTLAEGESRGVAGRNDFQQPGYGGPCPPPRHPDHRYYFTLYALDVESLGLPAAARRGQIEQAMEGHVLDRAQLMGRYRRTTA